ncbi:MAG: KH domain-containing protein [Spirochaetia bacterium]|nr:KH domain-containing protein [Spirochaetia bacterium]
MKELLYYVAGLLAADKDRVAVTETDDGMIMKYTVRVSKNDTKSLIGREGRTIKAIRSLLSMAAINRNIKKKTPVEIVEDN